jgi:hypothetical protein
VSSIAIEKKGKEMTQEELRNDWAPAHHIFYKKNNLDF